MDEDTPKPKAASVSSEFSKLWQTLFSTPVHLDSALSKLTSKTKSILAQTVPQILLRPTSQAEALGVGVPPEEPWNLKGPALANWRPAVLMVEKMYEMMEQGLQTVDPIQDDFPSYMIQEWQNSWDQKLVDELVSVLGREAPLSLRASTKVGAKTLLTRLTSQGRLPVRSELSKIVPFGVNLSGYAPVLKSEWYEKGAFEIQDEGSQFMALFAIWPEVFKSVLQKQPGRVKAHFSQMNLSLPEPKSSLTVIDACAGAGGKTLAIADALKGKGRVFAYDVSEKKLNALRRRGKRAGLNNIQVVTLEHEKENEVVNRFKGTADIVLVDAPCSGWGVLRRNPDIKWRQESKVLERMPEIQRRLLGLYSDLVAPGGRLVFGVCTFRRAETTDIVEQFLTSNPQFVAEAGGYLGPGPCDGFFMQSFKKTGKSG